MINKLSPYRLGLAFCAIAAMLLLSGCDISLLNPKGIISAKEKDLFFTSIFLMLIVVIPVIILVIVIPFHYRASNTHATYKPNWSHSLALEIVWWTIPIIIIAVLATVTWFSTHELDPYNPLDSNKKPVTVEVIALDWKWLFIYPEYNIATLNFLQLPVNTPINFKITSDAPMNSFMIPQLGSQIYAMQGMQTKLHILATAVGDYTGQSVNYSGGGFSGMKFVTHVTSEEEFKAWIASVRASQHPLSATAFIELEKQSSYNPVELFSDVVPHLYDNTIMKYMMMMPEDHSMDMGPQEQVTQ